MTILKFSNISTKNCSTLFWTVLQIAADAVQNTHRIPGEVKELAIYSTSVTMCCIKSQSRRITTRNKWLATTHAILFSAITTGPGMSSVSVDVSKWHAAWRRRDCRDAWWKTLNRHTMAKITENTSATFAIAQPACEVNHHRKPHETEICISLCIITTLLPWIEGRMACPLGPWERPSTSKNALGPVCLEVFTVSPQLD